MEKQEISDAPVTRSLQPDSEDDDVRIHRWPYPISSPFRSFSYFAFSGWLSLESFHELLSFFFYYTFEQSLLEFFLLLFFRFIIFPRRSNNCRFRRFDAFESGIDTCRGDLLVRLYPLTMWFFFFFSFWKKIVRILNSRICSNRHLLFPPSFRINNPRPAGHLSLKSLITNR